uniref:Uncharacterized protein n=1 Tax=Arundo donax TaxID=35708 RepID=A0A0A8ZEK4_ARUDO
MSGRFTCSTLRLPTSSRC